MMPPSDEKHCIYDAYSNSFSQNHHIQNHLTTHIDDKPYTCDVCGKSFSFKGNLQRHMTIHTGDKPYTCDVCGKGFREKNNLKQHMMRHTGDKPYKCGVCGKDFSHYQNLKKHIMIHTSDKPYSCDECGKRFCDQSNLKKHSMTYSCIKVHHCEVCYEAFSQIYNLQVHMKSHLYDKPYKCGLCGKSFIEIGHLQRHLSIHTAGGKGHSFTSGEEISQNPYLHLTTHKDDKPYKCGLCGKSFIKKWHLQRHLSIHTAGGKGHLFTSNECGEEISQNPYLHIRTHKDDKPYKCGFCGNSFIKKWYLQRHLSIHTAGGKGHLFSSNECGEEISQNPYLHVTTHKDDKPYKCGFCGKRFIKKWYLHKHFSKHTCGKGHLFTSNECGEETSQNHYLPIRTHKDDKPYKCGLCGKCFMKKGYLQRHLSIHTGGKGDLFTSNECGEEISQNPYLHVTTHKDGKPYTCDVCGKRFSSKYYWQRHTRIHTGDKPYKCDVCGKSFSQKGNLRRHWRRHIN